MITLRQRLAGSAIVVADAAVLWMCWPEPATLASQLAHPRLWVATKGADAAAGELARAGLWLCAAWLTLALVTVVASTLPGLVGRAGEAVADRAVPAFLRRGVVAAIGASVVLTPLAAGASPAGGHTRAPAVAASTSSTEFGARDSQAAALSDGWPGPSSAQTNTADQSTVPGRTLTPSQPKTPSQTKTPGQHRTTTPGAPVPWPRTSTPQPSGDVVVRSGDCLWAIAAHRLGPHASTHDIAVESQRWYDANRATIGADPGLIHPGQHLHQPTEKGPWS